MGTVNLYLLPIIAALVGWITNYIAIKMLFHPRRPINLIFFKLQGVFPKRQLVFAEKLGNLVANELLSSQDLQRALSKSVDMPELKQAIDPYLQEVLAKKLPEKMPMLKLILNQRLIDLAKNSFLSELDTFVNKLFDHVGQSLANTLNIKELVQEKVTNFSSDKLEEIIFSIMKKEFKFVELVGAVLGFLIGLVQLFLVEPNLIKKLYELFL